MTGHFKTLKLFMTRKFTHDDGEVLSINNKTQLRIAETEKYPHVTYFLVEEKEKFKGESRIVVNSPKVATYDLQPEMSAEQVTLSAINFIKTNCLILFA